MTAVVGIDLGTTNSCICLFREGQAKLIPLTSGLLTLPSWVTFSANDNVTVGVTAKSQSVKFPKSCLFDSKRLLGRRFDDAMVAEFRRKITFLNLVSEDDAVVYEIEFPNKEKRIVYPEEVAAHILRTLAHAARIFTGHSKIDVVITVPAYFNNSQRSATLSAAKIAGVNVIKLINEPTAAAVAYFQSHPSQDGNIVVVDFGGGTLDVTVCNRTKGKMVVKSTSGDSWLGGRDIDNIIMDHILKTQLQTTDLSASEMHRLREICEALKIRLSEVEAVEDEFNDEDISLTRSEFEQLFTESDMLKRCLVPLDKAMRQSGLNKTDINIALLVGGSCRIPCVRNAISQYFDGKISPQTSVHPDHAIAIGAAISAAGKYGLEDSFIQGLDPLDILSISIGIGCHDGTTDILIKANSPLPTSASRKYKTSTDGQENANIVVLQGESQLNSNNDLLGQFVVSGIPPQPRGTIIFDINLAVDPNGIVNVTATAQGTNINACLKIETLKEKMSEEKFYDVQKGIDRIHEKSERVKESKLALASLKFKAREIQENRMINNDNLKRVAQTVMEWVNERQQSKNWPTLDEIKAKENLLTQT